MKLNAYSAQKVYTQCMSVISSNVLKTGQKTYQAWKCQVKEGKDYMYEGIGLEIAYNSLTSFLFLNPQAPQIPKQANVISFQGH